MKHPFNFLPLENGAKLIFTPCPGSKEVGVQQSLEQLAAAGATAILTLMPREEMQRNGVIDLPELCAQLGLAWFHLPIEDDHAPEQVFQDAWQNARERIHALVNAGKTLVIHCKGGTGRTSLVAAHILLERGMPLVEVVTRVRAIRPNALQIPAHWDYITTLAQQISI